MLYKLGSSSYKFDKLEPVALRIFPVLETWKRIWEDLIAKSILDVLFEDLSLMPIYQEVHMKQ